MLSNIKNKIQIKNNQEIFKSKENNFFSKKKIFSIIVWTILLIVLIILVVHFILNIEFNELFKIFFIYERKNYINFILQILFGVGYFIYVLFSRIFVFWIRVRKFTTHLKIWDWLVFTINSLGLQIITPFSIGSEPYLIWWLNKKAKISIQKATILVSLNTTIWSLSQILITWPSFILISLQYNLFAQSSSNYIYWLILIGLIVDIVVALFIFLISYSSKFHVFFSKIYNFFKKKLKLQFITKDEIIEKYLKSAFFKKAYIEEWKKWEIFVTLVINITWAIYSYSIFISSYYIIRQEEDIATWFILLNTINVASTANNFIPIPSGEITIQYVIKTILEIYNLDLNFNIKNNSINNLIFVWRFFNNYILFFVSLFFNIFYFIIKIIKRSYWNIKNNLIKLKK